MPQMRDEASRYLDVALTTRLESADTLPMYSLSKRIYREEKTPILNCGESVTFGSVLTNNFQRYVRNRLVRYRHH